MMLSFVIVCWEIRCLKRDKSMTAKRMIPVLCLLHFSFCLSDVSSQNSDWILYCRPSYTTLIGDWGLWAMKPDGSSIQSLVNGLFFSPTASRDGTTFLFTAPHVSMPLSLALYGAPMDGSMPPTLLTPAIGWAMDPSFSPDKTRIVYHVYIPPQGEGLPTPTKTPKPGETSRSVNLNSVFVQPMQTGSTPSGDFIAIAHLDGSNAIGPLHLAVPGQGAVQIWKDPDWHPTDENKIAVSIRGLTAHPGSALYLIDPGGTSIRELFTPYFSFWEGIAESDAYPAWSPDGQSIVYARQFYNLNTMASAYALFLMRADASDAPGQQITPGDMVQGNPLAEGMVHPSWSADGQWIVFSVAVETSAGGVPTRFDLYKVRRDGTGLTRLTNDGKSIFPCWFSGASLPALLFAPSTPEATSPPLPTSTHTQVPVQPTSTFTPAATFTPKPIATATPVVPSPIFLTYEFDKPTLAENGWGEVPGGFTGAPGGGISPIGFFSNPIPSSADQKGLAITVKTGEVAFAYAKIPIQCGNRPVLLRLTARADGPDAAIALAALKGNLENNAADGSIATHIPATAAAFVEQERTLVLLYEPDAEGIVTPVIQVASTSQEKSVTALIDRLEVMVLDWDSLYQGQLFYAGD